jgi:hypothetical protein
MRVAELVHQLAGHPLHHVGVALAKSLACGQLESGVRALGQADQLVFHGRRQLARTQRQRRRLFVEGIDHIASRAGQAVMQREKEPACTTGRSEGVALVVMKVPINWAAL